MNVSESSLQAYEDVEIRIFLNYEKDFVGEITRADERASCKLGPPPTDELEQENNPRAYGKKLFSWLFRDDLLECFKRARWSAESFKQLAGSAGRMRLRLWLDQQVTELHRLRWEAMVDPERDDPVALDTAFSRYLRVNLPRGWPVSERPLKMMVVVSNPAGLDEFGLSPIDMKIETTIIGSATDSLEGFIRCDRLSDLPTLEDIYSKVEEGYHLIHVLAHATKIDDRSYLILSDEKGQARPVPFEDLSNALHRASHTPHFVFVATPIAMGRKVGEALFGLPQMLVESGVQAAVGIPSPMDDEKFLVFTQRFYGALIRRGTVDMAMTLARESVYDPDEWQWTHPRLFTRSPDAQLFQPLPESLETKIQSIARLFSRAIAGEPPKGASKRRSRR
jgi:hypothetical protein